MARVFITGSADGLGLELGRRLAGAGHEVILHGRSERRAEDARAAVPGARGALAGDLADVAETRRLAERVNALGPCDVVVHNAGVGFREQPRVTGDGVEHVFAVNVLAPYILTALVSAPARLIYLSSGLHQRGSERLDDLAWEQRSWNAMQAYCDSKLFDVVLARAVAERWPTVCANAVEPGWIATKMGGAGAPGTLAEGIDTQFWLATDDDPAALRSGLLFSDRRSVRFHPAAQRAEVQEALLAACEQVSGIALGPAPPGSAGMPEREPPGAERAR
jgi:NAD(P)-dependent dehydrogenase (short-subunit alcohol dehydrogenase family)